ncbi:MAG TPA: FxSxx-COOH system tetratricopeptide repeat protein [Ktedonobacteraceae bacterium]
MDEQHIHNEKSVQGQNIAQYQQITQNFHGVEGSRTPERLWMVPYRRNGFFTGRETLLTALHTSFTKDHTAVLTQGQAINGLGGIGKTQIAVEYAYRHQDEYRFVLWASAATHETLISGFVSIADGLQLPERTLKEQDKIVAAAQRWLSTHKEWLLIVDNADELGMVWPLLPTGSTGHVLVTTRNQAAADMESFLVEKMDRAEGTLLLLRRARILKPGMELEQVSLADRQVAELIVEEMDGLPLALDQAGAYIKETPCSLSDYLSLYRTRRAEMLKERGSPVNDYPESVATTWSISFQKVEQKSPAAAELLRLCAFLASDAIPEEIITAGAEHLGPLLQAAADDPLELNKAIAALNAYSLIRRDTTKKTVTIHRLVQAVQRDAMLGETQQQWMQHVVNSVEATFPESLDFAVWPMIDRLLPHALICVTWIEQASLATLAAARLLNQTGYYLKDRTRFVEAESLYQRARKIWEELLGDEHPDTTQSLNNLAMLYQEQGKYDQAEPLLVRALTIRERVLGLQHPHTATCLNNLAMLYRAQGKYDQAEPLFQQALAIREQALGTQHPHTATSMGNLAGLYESQQIYAEAEPLYEQALRIMEELLGAEHPDTATSMNNLAFLYNRQGRYAEAEPLYLRALRTREELLGKQHPETMTSVNNLAGLYNRQGRYAEAEPLYLRALRTREELLGKQHPSIAQSMNNLAFLYESQGKYVEAKLFYAQALAIVEHILGQDHPNTQLVRQNYASLLRAMGRNDEAQQLEEGNES